MKASVVALIVMMVSLIVSGCVQRGAEVADVRRENAELKSRVAALESEVAELKVQRTPLAVNGLTLGALMPPPELKLTSSLARPADTGVALGQGRITYIAGGGGDVALSIRGTGTLEEGRLRPATTTTRTTTTKKSPATSTPTPAPPAK